MPERTDGIYRLFLFSAPAQLRLVELTAVSIPDQGSICAVPRHPTRRQLQDEQDCFGIASVRTDDLPPRKIPLAQLQEVEAALAKAGFATAPPGAVCAAGPSWVLEAMVAGRYRYAAGGACAPGPLDPAVKQVAALGRLRL